MSGGLLFETTPRVVNVGLERFAEALRVQGVTVAEVAWRPPAGGDRDLVRLLLANHAVRERVAAANAATLDRLFQAQPRWVDVARAGDVVPGLKGRVVLHAGPAIPYREMCGPQRRAAAAAAVFEGWADDLESAARALQRGAIGVEPASAHGAVCPMAGVITPSMAVHVVQDEASGRQAYSPLNEGRGASLWFGNPNRAALERLAWFRDEFGPTLRAALRRAEGVDLPSLFAQSVQMGDDLHVRCVATTALLLRALVAPMLEAEVAPAAVARAARFLEGNSLFSLTVTMAACKVAADIAHGVPGSSVVTGMCRNGVEFGLRVGGLGDRWLTAPAPRMDEAIYYAGYSVADAAGDIGDSAVLEVVGLGGMAIAAAPTIAAFVGGSVEDQVAMTHELRAITIASHPKLSVPALGFAGTPTGVDVRKVVETGIVPIITTGAIHERDPEVGQIGAGIARAPLDLFRDALRALGEEWFR